MLRTVFFCQSKLICHSAEALMNDIQALLQLILLNLINHRQGNARRIECFAYCLFEHCQSRCALHGDSFSCVAVTGTLIAFAVLLHDFREVNVIEFRISKLFFTEQNSFSCDSFVLIVRVNVNSCQVVFAHADLIGRTSFSIQAIEDTTNNFSTIIDYIFTHHGTV